MGTQVVVNSLAFGVPSGICEACGNAPAIGSLTKHANKGNTHITLKFPLCESCDSVQYRIDTARKSIKRMVQLLAALLAACIVAVVLGGYVNAHGFGSPSTWASPAFVALVLFLPFWGILTWVMDEIIVRTRLDPADPQDRARRKAIESSVRVQILEEHNRARKVSTYEWGAELAVGRPTDLASSRGRVSLAFANQAYSQAFELANAGIIQPVA